jgi:hypothetical protein
MASLSEVVVETHPHAVERRIKPFRPHMLHHVLSRFSEPDSACGRINSSNLADAVRHIVPFLVVDPNLLRASRVGFAPGRNIHERVLYVSSRGVSSSPLARVAVDSRSQEQATSAIGANL